MSERLPEREELLGIGDVFYESADCSVEEITITVVNEAPTLSDLFRFAEEVEG